MVPKSSLAAIATLAAGALIFELTLTRLLSVALWYPFAYLAIGVAMLGFGTAAVWFVLSPRLQQIQGVCLRQYCAIAFAASIAVGYPIWNQLPLAPMSLASDRWQILWLLLLALLLALPFAAVGLFVAQLFGEHPRAAPYVYACDLVGAAFGVGLYVVLLGALGAPAMLYVAATLGIATALIEEWNKTHASLHRQAALILGCALVLGAAPQIESIQPLRVTPNKLMGSWHALGHKRKIRWTPSSAIEVISNRLGTYIILDGGTAITQVPIAPKATPQTWPRPQTLRALAYELSPGRSTLVIGSGGGQEIAAAMWAGSNKIVALEIDGAINDLVTGPLSTLNGNLFLHPSVSLHTAEARSFLEAIPSNERFDVIVGFHTISNAASITGAMSLSESYLMTVEAMALLLEKLSPEGVLVLSRPEQQMGRLVATVAAAWDDATNGPLRDHVAVMAHGTKRPAFLTALAVSKRPITQEQYNPKNMPSSRALYVPWGGDAQQYYAHLIDGNHQHATALSAQWNFTSTTVTPVTDDRPFFNMPRPWGELDLASLVAIFTAGTNARYRLEDLPIPQVTTLLLLVLLIGLCAVAIIPALRRVRVSNGDATRIGLSFCAYGMAFMMVEIVLIQVLTRVVGEPGWSMVVVLGLLLIATGVSAAWLTGHHQCSITIGCITASMAALATGWGVPAVADSIAWLPFTGRIGIAAIVVIPIGLGLGIPFTATLRHVQGKSSIAWALACNSVASVAGSIATLIFSSTFGFALTATVAAVLYGMTGFAWHRPSRVACGRSHFGNQKNRPHKHSTCK